MGRLSENPLKGIGLGKERKNASLSPHFSSTTILCLACRHIWSIWLLLEMNSFFGILMELEAISGFSCETLLLYSRWGACRESWQTQNQVRLKRRNVEERMAVFSTVEWDLQKKEALLLFVGLSSGFGWLDQADLSHDQRSALSLALNSLLLKPPPHTI